MNLVALVPAVVFALVLTASSPYVGRGWTLLQTWLPRHYRGAVVGLFAAAVLAIVIAAVVRIRAHRTVRYTMIVLGIAIAGAYAGATRTGEPVQDLAERLHFLEYGIVTTLFYFAWRRRGDITALLFPVFAALLTGLADEVFQWFVPSRVGEMRDVLLNTVAVVCGLLIAGAVAPPASLRLPADRRSRRLLAANATVVVVAAAVFLQTVHLGYAIEDERAGTFRSRFDRESLAVLAADRDAKWRLTPPPADAPLIAREDHYLTEALFHIARRNDAVSARDHRAAWQENLILERYYQPVLELASPTSRWPPEQRAEMSAAVASEPRTYVSDAYALPLYVWNRAGYWAVVTMLVGLVWLVALR